MDLFDENNLIIEQKFMLMLNDKIDKLIDNFNELKININPIIPKENELMTCNDKNMWANTAFIRIHLKNELSKNKFIEYLEVLNLINYDIYIDLTKNLLVKVDENVREDKYTYLWTDKEIDENNITIQGILQFKKNNLISDIGNNICNKFVKDIIIHNGGEYGKGLYVEPLENGRSIYIQLYYLYYIHAGNQKIDIHYKDEYDKWDLVDMEDLTDFIDEDTPPSMEKIQLEFLKFWSIGGSKDGNNSYKKTSEFCIKTDHHPLLKSMAEYGYEND